MRLVQTANLLEKLVSQGVYFRVHEDHLEARAEGGLRDDWRQQIRENKRKLKDLVSIDESFYHCQDGWKFGVIYMPSQVQSGMVDIFLVGQQLGNDEELKVWFRGRATYECDG